MRGEGRSVAHAAAMVLVLIALAAGIRALAASFPPPADPMVGPAMAAGFLFLIAHLSGRIAKSFGLPRVTGYLLIGVVAGPELLGLVTFDDLGRLSLLSRVAIGVIAFIAGAELRPALLRRHGRVIATMLVLEVLIVFALVGGGLFLARSWIPFLAERTVRDAVILAAVFASIATIHSPAVTIAVLNEEKPVGPVSEVILGVVVAADVLVVLLVTLTLAVARVLLVEGAGFDATTLVLIAWELVGAIIAGAILGALIDLYLRTTGARLSLLVIFVILLGDQLARALHVEFMLFLISAGFFVESVSPVDGEPLVQAVERVSVPAYAVFFALAGASIHLADLRVLGPLALAVVAVRAAGILLGTRAGGRIARASDDIRRYTWMGLVSQAGVALGLVTVAGRVLPQAGGEMRTLFLAMIAIHELIGPVLLRMALTRSGEIVRGEGLSARTDGGQLKSSSSPSP